jgi:polysaccharide biosynthesis/export protein
MVHRFASLSGLLLGSLLLSASVVMGQQPPAPAPQPPGPGQTPSAEAPPARGGGPPAAPAGVTPPPGYVIGMGDVLAIVFWRDEKMSANVTVRPDGKISLPLLNDIQAAGLTPDQLRTAIVQAAGKYIQEPDATVVVSEIKSRFVYILGNVAKPGTYPITGELKVLQLIALAGGLFEYADSKNIVVMQTENGQLKHRKFNYNEVIKQKRPEQNVVLQPGDTVVVQ